MEKMDCQDGNSEMPEEPIQSKKVEKVLGLLLKSPEVLSYIESTDLKYTPLLKAMFDIAAEIVELLKEYEGDVEQWLKAVKIEKVEVENLKTSEQPIRSEKIKKALGLILKNSEIPSILLGSNSKDTAPFWEAVIDGSDELNKILEKFDVGVGKWSVVDKNTGNKTTFLSSFASSDDWQSKMKIAEALVKIGADINTEDANNFTPIEILVNKGNVDCIEFLLKNGANINSRSVTKLLFKKPVMPKRKEILKLFIEHDSDLLNKVWASEDETLLNYVSKLGNEYTDLLEIAEILIDAEDPDKPDEDGDSNGNAPLHNAIEKQNLKLISLLLRKGANVNKPRYCSAGATPLLLAVQFDNVELINLLLSFGARINDKTDVDEMTALHGACICRHERIIDLLIQNGADISAVNNRGSTPLSILLEDPKDENSDLCIRAMVKEFSRRSCKNFRIFAKDMDLIEKNAKAMEHFGNCKRELTQMVNTVFHESITYYSVLNFPKNSRRLVPMTKNEELASQFREYAEELVYYGTDLLRIWERTTQI